MSKLSIKPFWVVGLALLVAAAAAIKMALAVAPFNPADQPIGYIGQDEVSNFSFKGGDAIVFRGQYEREFWSGTLFAYKTTAGGDLQPGTGWWAGDAGELISLQNFDSGRLIATMKDDGSKIAFRWADMSPTQQAYFGTNSDIVNFLRGDRSNEVPAIGKTLRQRISVMGDVIHTRPYYVADATNPTVFVGANDGMLHAINAAGDSGGGKERWAYVPSMLLPKMSNLSVNPYVHDYYVDGQINVATISSGSKRILVGGLGGGGRGLYALDITGSAGLTAADEAGVAAKVMWEVAPTKVNYQPPIDDNAYVNLGYTYGTVTIANVDGVDAVIIGNGYNDGNGAYGACVHAVPNYANCGGDYAAYLYVIDAASGQLISKIKAGADGSAASPNGLSTPAAVDSNGDGSVDTVYAGDLNGTMWKFDLVAGTSTALLTTSPAQAITSTPAVAIHPNGGYMVGFGTGKMLLPSDETDNSVHYVYGIWDGAPLLNAVLLEQTLGERNYVAPNGTVTRVRRVTTSNQPVWASGALNHKGWKVALSPGERVVGEGSFMENGRFYFSASNPIVSTPIASTLTIVKGENFLMELDYLTGGTKNVPFLDLSGDINLDNQDRIKYNDTDTLPVTVPATAIGDPILGNAGVPVGKFISIGQLSQPILIQLTSLNDTLFNQNPDIVVPIANVDRGVEGGHFDVEIYYGKTAGTSPTATITVGTSGQTNGYPATMGAITVNGVIVVPPLTVADLANGTSSDTNATVIKNKVLAASGFTATVAGNKVTLKAPKGTAYNNASITISDGSSQALVPAVITPGTAPPTNGVLVITDVTRNRSDVSVKCGAAYVTGAPGDISSLNDTNKANRLNDLFTKISGVTGKTVNGYTTTCTKGGSPTSSLSCSVSAPPAASACANFNLNRITTTTNTGPVGGTDPVTVTAATGWTNLTPALVATTLTGGVDPVAAGDTCNNGTSKCQFKEHDHEYDDIYDRTGVNFLDASNANFDLEKAIPLTTTEFKVIAQNQYLSPAVKLHINGTPIYNPVLDAGYISIKNYQTSATLDLATVPTYSRATVNSMAFNLPPDAFSNKDWWGGVNGLPADVRDGLHPTEYFCATFSASATEDGNMYQPVIPPATVTADGNGTKGYSSATTQTTATGVRHNGALTVQIIRADTPNSAIELSIPGQPEYGWRVNAALYSTYVLAEYSTFHHTKHLGLCYGDAGWTKSPPADTRICGKTDTITTKKCAVELSPDGGTDPKIGNLGGGSAILSTDVTVTPTVTTTVINYANGLKATIVRTTNSDQSITIVTTDSGGTVTTQVIADKSGSVKTGGDERGLQARTGRISWRELVAP